jgi:hypothetical protein
MVAEYYSAIYGQLSFYGQLEVQTQIKFLLAGKFLSQYNVDTFSIRIGAILLSIYNFYL